MIRIPKFARTLSTVAAVLILASAPLALAGIAVQNEQRVNNPDLGTYGQFYGQATAATDDQFFVSAPQTQQNFVDVYGRDGEGSWTIVQSLPLPPGAAPASWAGASMAAKDDVLLVSAHLQSSVHVYRLADGAWAHSQVLTAPEGDAGSVVAFDGQTAAISSLRAFSPHGLTGVVDVYELDAAGFTKTQRLVPSSGAHNDYFGQRIAIDGDVLAIIAYYADHAGANTGAAYIFENDGSGWTESVRIDGSGSSGSVRSVAVSEGRVAIARPTSVDIFAKEAGAWVLEESVPGSATTLQLKGSTLGVGNAYASRVELHTLGEDWSERTIVTPQDNSNVAYFATSFAFGSDAIVVGAPETRDGSMRAGAVFMYDAEFPAGFELPVDDVCVEGLCVGPGQLDGLLSILP